MGSPGPAPARPARMESAHRDPLVRNPGPPPDADADHGVHRVAAEYAGQGALGAEGWERLRVAKCLCEIQFSRIERLPSRVDNASYLPLAVRQFVRLYP